MTIENFEKSELDFLQCLVEKGTHFGVKIESVYYDLSNGSNLLFAEAAIIAESLFEKGFVEFWNGKDVSFEAILAHGMRINLAGYREIEKRLKSAA